MANLAVEKKTNGSRERKSIFLMGYDRVGQALYCGGGGGTQRNGKREAIKAAGTKAAEGMVWSVVRR